MNWLERHNKPNVFMNFGAGVQSTAIALMVIARDERLMVDRYGRKRQLPNEFIFADTGDEPADIYPHLEKIARMLRAAGHDFTIVRKVDEYPSLSASLIDAALSGTSGGVACPPAFVKATGHRRGIALRRTCTTEWKVRPIEAHIKTRLREIFGEDENKWYSAVQWLGYSADEAYRAQGSEVLWRDFEYPLIDAGITRSECHALIERSTYDDGSPMVPMRSACVYCPHHSRYAWERVAQNPVDWELALRVDEALEKGHALHGRVCGMRQPLYLTPQGWRLREAGFEDPAQIPMFADDLGDDLQCEHGVCGV